MIKFKCPQCGTQYEIEDLLQGAKVECAVCSQKFYAPETRQPMATETIAAPPPIPSHPSASENKLVISFDDVPASPKCPVSEEKRKLSPRQRRLLSDLENMRKMFSSFQYIHLLEAEGEFPEKYLVEYHVRGIERIQNDQIFYRKEHLVEIKLPGTYPRTQPICRMLTPIFHPNIEPAVICIGDHWTAGERLCDLVIRIGEIITYQSYNIKSPLDGEAAMWADLHENLLPVDKCDLTPPEND